MYLYGRCLWKYVCVYIYIVIYFVCYSLFYMNFLIYFRIGIDKHFLLLPIPFKSFSFVYYIK